MQLPHISFGPADLLYELAPSLLFVHPRTKKELGHYYLSVRLNRKTLATSLVLTANHLVNLTDWNGVDLFHEKASRELLKVAHDLLDVISVEKKKLWWGSAGDQGQPRPNMCMCE